MSGAVRAEARVVVYLEDAPLDANALGGGLARVNSALLAGLAQMTAGTLLVQTHGRAARADWDVRFAAGLTVPAEWRRRGLVAAGRLGGAIARVTPALFLRGMAAQVRVPADAWLFAPIGTDIGTAERALYVARQAKLRCMLYFVDDIVAADRARGAAAPALATRVERAIRAADVRFAITDALAAKFTRRHGVACMTLPLPFEARGVPMPGERLRDVVHIGAINHIYEAGLVTTARALAEANRDGAALRMRLTATPPPALRAELAALVPLDCAPLAGEGALVEYLARALCAVVPVEREPSGMYATSFPSKLLEYLNACRSIVVLGPQDASAVRYFRDNALDHVATDGAALARRLATLAARPPDAGPRYRAALARTNGPDVVAGRIARAMAAGAAA